MSSEVIQDRLQDTILGQFLDLSSSNMVIIFHEFQKFLL